MYLVIHGEVRVLIVRSGWATLRTSGQRVLLRNNRSLWLKECVVQLRLCWKRKSSGSSNSIKILSEYRRSAAGASKSKTVRNPHGVLLLSSAWW